MGPAEAAAEEPWEWAPAEAAAEPSSTRGPGRALGMGPAEAAAEPSSTRVVTEQYRAATEGPTG